MLAHPRAKTTVEIRKEIKENKEFITKSKQRSKRFSKYNNEIKKDTP
jgi:hypothetical protein